MKTVNCEGVEYLNHETTGNAARFIEPMALEYCKGKGLDIGYSKTNWRLPNADGVEPSLNPDWDAMRLPDYHDYHPSVNRDSELWDYIFSSHCLEHVKENWYNVLDYWLTKIKVGGILFLYLPHASQNYWQPRNNRKHVHSFSGDEIGDYLKGLGHQVFVSGVDANHSFTVICEKKETRKVGWYHSNDEQLKDIPALRHQLAENEKILFGNGNPINTGSWFEQNTDDLANKIADMRMADENRFKYKTCEEVEIECWDLYNIERQKRNLSALPFKYKNG